MTRRPARAIPEAPAPRDRAGLAAELFGLAAGPAAWIAQLTIDYGLSSYACFPGDAPAPGAQPAWERPALLAVNLICLALALGGLAVSLANRRRLGDAQGRAAGRGRFLALCGVLASAGFAIAIAFNAVSAVALRTCWRIPS